MNISKSYRLYAVTIILLLTSIGVIAFKAAYMHDDVVKSEKHRFRSFKLAMELFQSSEDLTRMARSYVSTGNPVYKKRYFEILDIRNGKVARPKNYLATFWYLAGTGKGVVELGEPIALQELMRREGFTEQEFTLLRESQANSDHLVKMEKQAFAAVKGLYDNGKGNFTVRRAPDRAYAVSLMFSKKYYDEKAQIMAPIQKFMDLVDERTKVELSTNTSKLRRYILLIQLLIILTLLVVAIKIKQMYRNVLHPLARLSRQISEFAKGNYTARSDISSADEIGELCRYFNNMADTLESDIKRRINAEDVLRKSEEQQRLLLNSTGEAIYGIDLQGNCTFANPSCLRTLGYSDLKQLLGKNMHRLIHHSYSDGNPMPVEVCRIYKAFHVGKGEHVDDEVLWRANGTSFPAEYWSYPQIEDGNVCGAVVAFVDITERKQAEEKIKHSEEKLKEAQHIAQMGNWELDIMKKTLLWSDGIYEIFEINPIKFGASYEAFLDLIHPDDREMVDQTYTKSLKKRTPYEISHRLLMKDGRIKWVNEICRTEYDRQGNPLKSFGIVQDITEQKQSEEKIQYMATHDTLTDLPSLRLAKDRLHMAINSARRYNKLSGVMFIDLDGFKNVNDTFGHEAGDDVLRQVAKRLSLCIRKTDTAARVGGDEFLIILTELQKPEDAEIIAKKIIKLISEPYILAKDKAFIGASIGISIFPEDADDIESLIKLADEAMYKIKNSGKNNYLFAGHAK